jgi:hypothetical protein
LILALCWFLAAQDDILLEALHPDILRKIVSRVFSFSSVHVSGDFVQPFVTT